MYLRVHDAVVRRMGSGWAQLKFPGGVTPAVSDTSMMHDVHMYVHSGRTQLYAEY